MSLSTVSRLSLLFFGADPRQKRIVRMTLMGAGVYALALSVLAIGQALGVVSAGAMRLMAIYDGTGAIGFYLMTRFGVDVRWGKPGMTGSQMSYGLISLGLAYVALPLLRGGIMMIAPLVLLYGAFALQPRRCAQLGWFAVAIFAVAFYCAAMNGTGAAARPAFVEFGFILFVVPATARLAGLLSALRAKTRLQKTQLTDALEKIRLLASRDPLTGLPNRRRAIEHLEGEGTATGANRRLSICLIDLDNFKRINDTYGHGAGDTVLCTVASNVRALLRPTDVFARWGGEEFLILLPDTDVKGATVVLERLRRGLSDAAIWAGREQLRVTFSAGVAAHSVTRSIEQTLECADRALYEAKSNGRNRIVVAQQSGEIIPTSPSSHPVVR